MHLNATTHPLTAPKLVASVLGIGYIGRGSGTIAAGLVVGLWIAFGWASLPIVGVAAGVIALCVVGVLASTHVEKEWGVDSARVVVDEVGGMAIALIGLPGGWPHALAAFALFRLLDITKPLGIAHMEKLPGGWGVMGDDVLAGIYTNIALQIVVLTGLWPAS